MLRTCFGVGLIAAAVCLGACGGGSGSAAAADSARQAVPAGAAVYDRECAGCHGKSGEGIGKTPAVMGEGALPLKGADGHHGPFRTAQDVFDYVKREMPLPESKAGSLSDQDYWAVTAYMLAGSGRKLPGGKLNAETAQGVVVNAE